LDFILTRKSVKTRLSMIYSIIVVSEFLTVGTLVRPVDVKFV